ncbi:MAG: 23S rRNA (guanosine(2251)-2'-O)-methyltransferase RlmB [Candidatus Binatia bacterium]|nr:23S rRNA (guanosine(2251)-2'-O)-methyltransferase RlmB [Candidatus Binatia bacterium]
MACGWHAVAAFLKARPDDVEGILATRENRTQAEYLASDAKVRVETSDPKSLGALSGGATHQGIAALGRPPRFWDLEEVLATKPDILVVLDGLTDPRNIGAILRTAEAAGAGGVIVAKDRAPGLTPSLVKAAAGAVEWLPIARVTNLVRSLGTLRSAGIWVIGLDGEAELNLGEPGAVPGLPAALVMGAEGEGVRPLMQKSCDRLVGIPMTGRTESLNVSVAAGIGLWELSRLRRGASS